MTSKGRGGSYSSRNIRGVYGKTLIQGVLSTVETPTGTKASIRKPQTEEQQYVSYADRFKRDQENRMAGIENYEGKIISERTVRLRKKRAQAKKAKEEAKLKEAVREKELAKRELSIEQEKFLLDHYWVSLTDEQIRERGIKMSSSVRHMRNTERLGQLPPSNIVLGQGKSRFSWAKVRAAPPTTTTTTTTSSLTDRLMRRAPGIERARQELAEVKKEVELLPVKLEPTPQISEENWASAFVNTAEDYIEIKDEDIVEMQETFKGDEDIMEIINMLRL